MKMMKAIAKDPNNRYAIFECDLMKKNRSNQESITGASRLMYKTLVPGYVMLVMVCKIFLIHLPNLLLLFLVQQISFVMAHREGECNGEGQAKYELVYSLKR